MGSNNIVAPEADVLKDKCPKKKLWEILRKFCGSCKIFKNMFFTEHLQATASAVMKFLFEKPIEKYT